MNFLPGASLPVLARGRLILEVNSLRTVRLSTALLSLDVADEVGLFTVLPFFQRKLDRTRPSSTPPPPPPPSSRHPPWRRLPNEESRGIPVVFLSQCKLHILVSLGVFRLKSQYFLSMPFNAEFCTVKRSISKKPNCWGPGSEFEKKKKKKKPTSEVSRAGFTPFFLPFFSHSEAWSQAMKAGTLV